MHNTTLAELLLTHLCHEFAGPVGAISNGAELLEETDSSVYLQARKLVQSSAKDIIYRLQFYRAAYGVCSTSGEADLSLLVQICNNYISQRREVTLTWPVVLPEFSSIEAKLLQNCLILLLRQLRQGEMALRPYPDQAGVAQRLMKNNHRLSPDKAHWLSAHWAEQQPDGQWIIRGHPAHKVINAQLYQAEEAKAIYQRISAPTLVVHASDDSLKTWTKGKYGREEFLQRVSAVAQLKNVTMPDTGHMLHHDQPQELAQLIDAFLASA